MTRNLLSLLPARTGSIRKQMLALLALVACAVLSLALPNPASAAPTQLFRSPDYGGVSVAVYVDGNGSGFTLWGDLEGYGVKHRLETLQASTTNHRDYEVIWDRRNSHKVVVYLSRNGEKLNYNIRAELKTPGARIYLPGPGTTGAWTGAVRNPGALPPPPQPPQPQGSPAPNTGGNLTFPAPAIDVKLVNTTAWSVYVEYWDGKEYKGSVIPPRETRGFFLTGPEGVIRVDVDPTPGLQLARHVLPQGTYRLSLSANRVQLTR